MTTPQYREMKCPACGWVHMSVPEHFARESGGAYERYLRRYQCGAPSSKFVPALADDASVGCTLQPCVVVVTRASMSNVSFSVDR